MPTERLYFHDPYLTGFSARVVRRAEDPHRHGVALDRTAFYPEGGGQPPDRGMLNEIRVLDVQSDADGTVWHWLDGVLDDDLVQGQIDWPRRFDHMQQHHGQHLLSAAFEELFHRRTIAFHLGTEYATIDLEGEAGETECLAAESRTNEIIWEDRPVEARFVTVDELATLPLRKPPTVEGPVRVVSVPDFDYSACGGTHPRSTGAVGLLHVRRRERRGGDTRVEFVCGARVLRDLRTRGALLQRLGTLFTAGLDDLEAAVVKLREQEEFTRKRLAQVSGQLLDHEAGVLAAAAAGTGGVVSAIRHDLALDEARQLARLVAEAGATAVIGVRAEKAHLVMARPASSTDVDCGRIIQDVLAQFGGRGGGQAAAAQGGIPEAGRLSDAVERAAELARGLGNQI